MTVVRPVDEYPQESLIELLLATVAGFLQGERPDLDDRKRRDRRYRRGTFALGVLEVNDLPEAIARVQVIEYLPVLGNLRLPAGNHIKALANFALANDDSTRSDPTKGGDAHGFPHFDIAKSTKESQRLDGVEFLGVRNGIPR